MQVLADPRAALELLGARRRTAKLRRRLFVVAASNREGDRREIWAPFTAKDRPLLIVCADCASLSRRALAGRSPRDLSPDIVVFDESFVDFAVPFGAFAASKRLYDHWNKRGMATFHSTTFQPNTISNLHFMRCLHARDPDFIDRHAEALDGLEHDVQQRARSIGSCLVPRSRD